MNPSTEIFLQTYLSQASFFLAQSRFSQDGISMTTMLISAGVLIGIAATGWLAYQYLHPNAKKNCPGRLFRALCREHKLDWSEKALLNKLAQRNQLATTAEIFVTPECFDVNEGRAQQALLQKIDELREKLFGMGN